MDLRRARPDEADGLVALMHEAIAAHAVGAYDDEERRRWQARITPETIRQSIVDPEEVFLVAERSGTVAGLGSRKGTLVRYVYVHPREHGRGIGRRIMARLEADARAEGHAHLELDASKNALAFYTRCGFRRAAVVGCGGDDLLCVRMMKPIT